MNYLRSTLWSIKPSVPCLIALQAFVLLLSLIGLSHAAESASFVTSDGVRLHVIQSGPPTASTIVFVPGWVMPAWIWDEQRAAFDGRYRVVALDPRGQGDSEVPASGYDQARRGADIGDLITQLGPAPVVLVGWSLGVLDSLAYAHQFGSAHLAGLILIDNSIGEGPPPVLLQQRRQGPPAKALTLRAQRIRFIAGMFNQPHNPAFLARLTDASLRTPEWAARLLLSYKVPRSFWREAVLSVACPILYVVTPRLAEQARFFATDRPHDEIAIVKNAGHALFVDQPKWFNALMISFIDRRVWPPIGSVARAGATSLQSHQQ